MNRFLCVLCFAALLFSVQLQSIAQSSPKSFQFLEFDLGIAKSEAAITLSYNLDKGLGKKGKFVVGTGARFTSYFGNDQYYITAPANLTSGSTGPGVIFKENIEANIDTFFVHSAQVNCMNLMVSLGYNFSKKFMVRFNIDVVGISFGTSTTGEYVNVDQSINESSSPTAFNLLLVSDNDKGSLNSEIFARYLLNEKWGIKGGLQFHFTEYTTESKVQQLPEPNDRFRNKSLMINLGVSYKL